MTLTIDLDYKPKSLSRLMSKSIVKVFHKPLKVIKLWKSTYVTCAVTSMTPQSVIPTMALPPAPPLKIFPTIGVAHSAAWTNPISRSNNPLITKILKAASLKKRSRFWFVWRPLFHHHLPMVFLPVLVHHAQQVHAGGNGFQGEGCGCAL